MQHLISPTRKYRDQKETKHLLFSKPKGGLEPKILPFYNYNFWSKTRYYLFLQNMTCQKTTGNSNSEVGEFHMLTANTGQASKELFLGSHLDELYYVRLAECYISVKN